MKRLEAGEVVALGLGAVGLCSSAVLVRKGLRPTSTCVRTSWPLRLFFGYLLLHMVIRIPGDPLTWIGKRLVKAAQPVVASVP